MRDRQRGAPPPRPAIEDLINLPQIFVPNASLEFSVEHSNLLWALSAPPDQDAPAFMQGEAWAAKSCMSTLAGWVQSQHQPTPQHHASGACDCDSFTLPGFIEPNPKFYSRAGALAAGVAEFFEKEGAFAPLPDEEVAALRAAAAKAKAAGTLDEGNYRELSKDARARIDLVYDLPQKLQTPLSQLPQRATRDAYRLALIEVFETRATQLETGLIPPTPPTVGLSERWFRFLQLTNGLTLLSHQQLRGQTASLDQAFIAHYGQNLGFVMGYAETSWMMPRDDAPRWAEVHRQPAADRGFAVGIGRPRLIHVLYPYEGHEVLCTGSVMSYYEYWERDRLTDEQWKAKLDSPDAPAMPDWLTPYLAR